MRFAIDGLDIDYEERGEGRPIVLLHGLTTDRRILLESVEAALDRPGLRRIYLDLPGHGASGSDLGWASADGLVTAVGKFIAEIAGPDAAIVAHSYGAYLALGVLRDLPALAALFLVCPIVQPDVGLRRLPPQRFAVLEDGLQFRDDEERLAFDGEVSRYTADVLERFRRSVDPAHRAADRAFVAAVRARYVQSRPLWLRGYERPLSVVCGRDDYWAGYEDALALVRGAPRGELTILSECGHALPIERPDALQRLVGEWLEATTARR